GDGGDRQVAKSWNNERSRNRIYLHQPTITGENINGFINMNKNGTFVSGSSISKRDHEGDEHKDRTKKMKTIDSQIDEFFSPVKTHENMNNDHDNAEVALEPQCHLPEEELEDKARKLLKDYWEDVISTIEKFLMSRPDATPIDSDSDSASASTDQTMEQDGRAEDIIQYLTKISKNV
ncbi:18257_t:CDS:2, partial [Racocetra fulgida]